MREEVIDPAKQPSPVVEISENQIDQVMSMLNEADPTAPESDPVGKYQMRYIFFQEFSRYSQIITNYIILNVSTL